MVASFLFMGFEKKGPGTLLLFGKISFGKSFG